MLVRCDNCWAFLILITHEELIQNQTLQSSTKYKIKFYESHHSVVDFKFWLALKNQIRFMTYLFS